MAEIVQEKPKQDQLREIISELKNASKKLPREAIQAARQHKEQVIPELIRIIQQATQALQQNEKQDGNGAFFALFLLAEFRAAAALPAIFEAISLPGDGPFELFGEAIHDGLPRVLIALANDQCVETCSALVRNSAINEYVRWSAANAITYLAMAGLRPRADIVLSFRQLLAEAVEKKDPEAVTAIISTMIDLNPWEAAKEIEHAFKLNLVDEGMIDWESAAEHLQDQPMEPLPDYADPLFIEDTIEELQSWASFQESLPLAAPRTFPHAAPNPTPLRPTPPMVMMPRPSARVRVGRNDPCPCRSGKKFKKCCGRQAS